MVVTSLREVSGRLLCAALGIADVIVVMPPRELVDVITTAATLRDVTSVEPAALVVVSGTATEAVILEEGRKVDVVIDIRPEAAFVLDTTTGIRTPPSETGDTTVEPEVGRLVERAVVVEPEVVVESPAEPFVVLETAVGLTEVGPGDMTLAINCQPFIRETDLVSYQTRWSTATSSRQMCY